MHRPHKPLNRRSNQNTRKIPQITDGIVENQSKTVNGLNTSNSLNIGLPNVPRLHFPQPPAPSTIPNAGNATNVAHTLNGMIVASAIQQPLQPGFVMIQPNQQLVHKTTKNPPPPPPQRNHKYQLTKPNQMNQISNQPTPHFQARAPQNFYGEHNQQLQHAAKNLNNNVISDIYEMNLLNQTKNSSPSLTKFEQQQKMLFMNQQRMLQPQFLNGINLNQRSMVSLL